MPRTTRRAIERRAGARKRPSGQFCWTDPWPSQVTLVQAATGILYTVHRCLYAGVKPSVLPVFRGANAPARPHPTTIISPRHRRPLPR